LRAMVISLGVSLLTHANGLTFRTTNGTLPFLQVGFTTALCCHKPSTVAFISRVKTSVHFSPFVAKRNEYCLCGTFPNIMLPLCWWALPTTIFLDFSLEVRTFLIPIKLVCDHS